MTRKCIIIVDRAWARFITVETPVDPSIQGGPHLLEHRDLVNPEATLPERGLFSDRSGRAHASPTGAAHALDDHREEHLHEMDRRYARWVLGEAAGFVAAERASRLLIVAEPRLLGVLREQVQPERFHGVEITDLTEEIAQLPLEQIHTILAQHGAVHGAKPPRAGAVLRPRGQPPAKR